MLGFKPDLDNHGYPDSGSPFLAGFLVTFFPGANIFCFSIVVCKEPDLDNHSWLDVKVFYALFSEIFPGANTFCFSNCLLYRDL